MNTQKFSAGYSQLYYKMIMIAYKILRDFEEAKDVVSSVFSQAFENKERINETTFDNLISISVKNKSVDTLRSSRLKKTTLVPTFHENTLTCEEDFLSFDEKSLLYALNEAIEELPPIQKKLIKLKYLHGMDRKQMTSICNSNENTVRNNLAYGLKNLRMKMINNRNTTSIPTS